ncbi:MAG: NUDIX domain-containing protein [Cellvibrionaceae bacterium]
MVIKDPTYHLKDVEIIKRETAYNGFFKMEKLTLKHRLFEGGWTGEVNRELFVRGDAVAATLYDPRHDLIGMIEQFRVGALSEPYGPWCLEVVAGMIETGETPEQVMRRELKEEANVVPERLDYIGNYLSSPGGSDEKLHLYCCQCDLSRVEGVFGLESENEDIRVLTYPAQDVFANLFDGRFNNAATLICLQWLQYNHQTLRREQL